MRFLLIFPIFLCLAGCGPSRGELAKLDHDTCLSYGAKPGSDAYVQCRVMRDSQHAAQDRQDSVMAAGAMVRAGQGFTR